MTVLRAGAVSLGFRIGGTVAWALAGVLVARGLTVEGRGAYAVAVVGAAALLALLSGVPAAIGRSVARDGADPIRAVSPAGLAGALATIALLLAAGVAAWIGASTVAVVLLVGSVVALPAVVRGAVATVALARERVWLYNLGQHGPPLVTLALVGWLLLATDVRTAEGALAAWAAGQWLSLGLVALAAPRLVGGAMGVLGTSRTPGASETTDAPGASRTVDRLRALRGFAVPAGLTAFVAALGARVDLLVIATLAGRDAAGLYATATAAHDALTAGAVAIAVALYGRIGGLPGDEEAARLAVRWIRRSVVAVALLGVPLALAAPIAIELVFGARYVPAADAVRVMAVASVAWAPLTLFGTWFAVRLGRPGVVLAATAAIVVVEALLTAALVPLLGLVGGAVASLVAYAGASAGYSLAFWRSRAAPAAAPRPVAS